MEDKYTYADEVEFMARDLISSTGMHKNLAEARIKYLFRSGKWEKGDKVIFGRTKLASDDIRFIADFDFVIMINEEAWGKATFAQKKALLDHELSHCDFSEDAEGNRKWRVADHDVQEFIGVVYRHGLWEAELQKLMIAARNAPQVDGLHNQTDLFAPQEASGASEETQAVN